MCHYGTLRDGLALRTRLAATKSMIWLGNDTD
jgi:hypothetical protein